MKSKRKLPPSPPLFPFTPWSANLGSRAKRSNLPSYGVCSFLPETVSCLVYVSYRLVTSQGLTFGEDFLANDHSIDFVMTKWNLCVAQDVLTLLVVTGRKRKRWRDGFTRRTWTQGKIKCSRNPCKPLLLDYIVVP